MPSGLPEFGYGAGCRHFCSEMHAYAHYYYYDHEGQTELQKQCYWDCDVWPEKHAHYQGHQEGQFAWQEQWYYTNADWCTHAGDDGGPLSTGPNSPPLKTRYNQQETIERLGQMKNELEESAWDMLQTFLETSIQNEVSTEVTTCVERALLFFDYPGVDHTPRGAVDALKQVMQAIEMVERQSEEYEKLDAASKKVRDSLSVRTQLASLPMGDKKKYHLVLEHAYGGKIDDEENSRLMQSYRKTLWEKFGKIGGAFLSNNKIENLARGGPRPRRERRARGQSGQSGRRPPRGTITQPPGLERVYC